MQFVWTVKKSPYDEIRYSIRSVLKFHPDAKIFVIGDLPEWYCGSGVEVTRRGTANEDRTRKINIALGMFDEFVRMDDDMFLLEPFKMAHYYHGYFKERIKLCKGKTERQRIFMNTYELFPDEYDYNQHTPLAIYSHTIKEVPQNIAFKQWYCSIETRYPKVEQKDVKIRSRKESIPDAPFFSTQDNVKYLLDELEKMYPDVSHCENDT